VVLLRVAEGDAADALLGEEQGLRQADGDEQRGRAQPPQQTAANGLQVCPAAERRAFVRQLLGRLPPVGHRLGQRNAHVGEAGAARDPGASVPTPRPCRSSPHPANRPPAPRSSTCGALSYRACWRGSGPSSRNFHTCSCRTISVCRLDWCPRKQLGVGDAHNEIFPSHSPARRLIASTAITLRAHLLRK
jgi:hypothetical protein